MNNTDNWIGMKVSDGSGKFAVVNLSVGMNNLLVLICVAGETELGLDQN